MAEQLGGAFEKFVNWLRCAVVVEREAQQNNSGHCRQSTNFSNGPHVCVCVCVGEGPHVQNMVAIGIRKIERKNTKIDYRN
jgi:hypothetical protein